ncbi:MAG: PPC domain-containing DNA-binding protein, partial [Candidatus Micrarchaeota archaeon]
MDYRRAPDKRLNIRLDAGDELVASLKGICAKEGITNAVFFGIGACRKADIGHYDTAKKSYHNKTLEGMMEIVSLTGNVSISEDAPLVHAHIALGLADFSVQGGHANRVEIDPTCEIVLMPLEG